MKHLIIIIALLAVSLTTCKDENKPEINACGEEVTHSGIGKSQVKTITFWANKDYGCGKIKVFKILNKQTGSTDYKAISPEMTKYFPSGAICKETGSIHIDVLRGYTYEYTFSCDTKAWKGEFTATCDMDCQIIQIKEPVN